jgi:3-oxoacyl-[acyl-carrier-protein] synthase-3
MGTCIEAAATAAGRRLGRGALHLSDVAARACLRRGHRDAGDLDILVNAGLYKDANVAEPALTSIIQEDIGANPGSPPRRDRHGTFSFDVLDGGCGVVTAARVIDGFVGSGAARLGMVVAADADPSPRTTRGFPFAAAGGALLLAHEAGPSGFTRFESRTFADDADLFEAHVRWDADAGWTHRGRNVLEIYEAPAFAERCAAHAVTTARAFLDDAGLAAADVDLLIASQYPPRFGGDVAAGLGIDAGRVPHVERALARAHTAGPIAALEAAIADGRFARARHVLFVTAGAGITIGVALYRGDAAEAP